MWTTAAVIPEVLNSLIFVSKIYQIIATIDKSSYDNIKCFDNAEISNVLITTFE